MPDDRRKKSFAGSVAPRPVVAFVVAAAMMLIAFTSCRRMEKEERNREPRAEN
jgi:hypothetical protein